MAKAISVISGVALLVMACSSDDEPTSARAETTSTQPTTATTHWSGEDCPDDPAERSDPDVPIVCRYETRADWDAASDDAFEAAMSAPEATDRELVAMCERVFDEENVASWENSPPGLTADDLCASVIVSYRTERCVWNTVNECVRSRLRDEFSARFD